MSQVIFTDKAPLPVGPYSQAIKAGNTVYLSGQVPLDPATKKLVEGGIEAQTEQVMKNLCAVLEAAGCTFQNVVKTTVFLQDMNDFAAMNAVYAKYFTTNPPARCCVQVAKLPVGAIVEIECIACL